MTAVDLFDGFDAADLPAASPAKHPISLPLGRPKVDGGKCG